MSTATPSIPSDTLPDSETLEKAGRLTVFDDEGKKVEFKSIFAAKKTIVVFVRHFFCGICQAYVSELTKIPPKALEDANAQVVVIGCGQWNLIKNYARDTKFTGKIYADPTRELYKSLGMTIETLQGTPKGEKLRSYIPSGIVMDALRSIWRGPLQNPLSIGKQGNISQLGGDFVFGPGIQCSYARPMKHTQDHIEVADLMAAAGISP
ncbi:hypothetical protein SCHPADRAFT_870601 [Schizopora paradoxa]|uniref:AhpC-TSA-domain-containing protein n=1 Tax=Schizopora paradoxa TaxID=27342 RepID=A0A0H2RUV2_9AGAM|nr:hypothetical protein SCHPADRAFT_870601 [Schizopora paradoxa]